MRLREIRKAAGLSQKEIAEKIGTRQEQVSRWESGYNLPRMETICKLAAVLGCSIGELIADEIEQVKRK